MPCNVGYQETFRATVAAPASFRASGSGPALDQDLMDRLGIEDAEFLEWLRGLDVGPLLGVALERARKAVPGASFRLSGSRLEVEASRQADADRGLARWQFEVIAVIGEILGYQTRITSSPSLSLEANKPGQEHATDYFRVSQESDGSLRLRFEHFKSRRALDEEVRKLTALARRLGLDIRIEGGEGGPPGTAQAGGDPVGSRT